MAEEDPKVEQLEAEVRQNDLELLRARWKNLRNNDMYFSLSIVCFP